MSIQGEYELIIKPLDLIENRFRILGEIAPKQGTLGIIYKCYDIELDCKVAMKISKDRNIEKANRQIIKEIKHLRLLHHTNICPAFDIVKLYDKRIGYTMKFISGKTLKELCDNNYKFTDNQMCIALQGIWDGISYLHKNGIAHLDLHPGNILFTEDFQPLLCDFNDAFDLFNRIDKSQYTNYLKLENLKTDFKNLEYILSDFHKLAKNENLKTQIGEIQSICVGSDETWYSQSKKIHDAIASFHSTFYNDENDDQKEEFGWYNPDRSPIPRNEIPEAQINNIVSFIKEWKPDPTNFFIRESHLGLASEIASLSIENPDWFWRFFKEIHSVPHIYTNECTKSISKFIKHNLEIKWDVLFEVFNQYIDSINSLEDKWGEIRSEYFLINFLHIIQDIFSSKKYKYPIDSNNIIILEGVIEKIYNKFYYNLNNIHDHDKLLHKSLNTLPGHIVHTILKILMWNYQQNETTNLDKFKDILEKILDSDDLIIRYVFGIYLQSLLKYDLDWTEEIFPKILPLDKDEYLIWKITWYSYIRFNSFYVETFQLLREQYSYAIETLDNNQEVEKSSSALGYHLVLAYILDQISEDKIIEYYQKATAENKNNIVLELGNSLKRSKLDNQNEKDRLIINKLEQLWKMRIASYGELVATDESRKEFKWIDTLFLYSGIEFEKSLKMYKDSLLLSDFYIIYFREVCSNFIEILNTSDAEITTIILDIIESVLSTQYERRIVSYTYKSDFLKVLEKINDDNFSERKKKILDLFNNL